MAAITQNAPAPAHELVYEPESLPKLRSNYGDYLNQDSVGRMREVSVDTPMEEMRRRFEEDGYLFVRNVMPRDDVLDVRQAYFEHLAPTGILKPGTSPRDGIFDSTQDPVVHNGVGGRDLPEDRDRVDRLVTAHTHPMYNFLLEHPKLRGFVREFMGWDKDVLVKRTLLRHNVPHGFSTGIHYDRIFLRQGEAEFLTAWVPIGDCSAEGGGLMYMEDSTEVGKAMEADFMQRAAHFIKEERINSFNANMAKDGQLSHNVHALSEEIMDGKFGGGKRRRWLVGDYKAGDVVFHNPYMIHGAVKNEDPQGRIRLATDLRFYEEGADLDTRWMRTGIPSSISSLAQPTGGPQAPAPTSYSYTYTVTTPTTQWNPPAFSTPAPIPTCAGTIAAMCPALNGQTCLDPQRQSYGVLCNTRFSGIVITTSGKKYLMEREEDLERIKLEEMYMAAGGTTVEKRDFQGNFTNCAGFCDGYPADVCVGVYYEGGWCMAYSSVSGTFNSPYGMAALRDYGS
ncbi:hypothetical protein NU219Hw_g8453t1 [Hortaea werneckii]